MKRTGFKRAVFERPPRTPVGTMVSRILRGIYARADDGNVATPKREYVRSRALLDSVRLVPRCAFCALVRPVVACHSNWAVHGKGKSVKADDNRIAAGCQPCHAELDQGKTFEEPAKQAMWWAAHVWTVEYMVRFKLWPADVPVPDTESYPWA